MRAEELALMKKSLHLNEKRHTFLFCELHLCKQLWILGNKKKEIFAPELASIKDLEEQAANKTTVAAEIPESISMVDLFSGLFDSLLPSVLAAFAGVP